MESGYTTFGTANEKGSGLGLLLCKEFVNINGGTIWAVSKESKGTSFKFTIPNDFLYCILQFCEIYMYIVKKVILLFLSSLIFCGCAVIVEPSGGPDDTTPPEILDYTPINATINLKSDNSIKILFSEYVNKSSVIDNIRISPKVPLDFSWSGKELEISFLDTLLNQTTYCLTIDSKYTDNNGVKPVKAFSMIFSTGDKIDSGKIVGKVYSKKSGYSVFAYKIIENTADTFDLRNKKADYYISVGSSGEFALNALKDGLYRVILVNDINDNQIYNEGFEDYSSSKNDILVRQDSVPEFISFFKTNIIDTLRPQLFDAEAISNKMIKLEFSEPIDTFSISTKCFFLTDSVSNISIPILTADNPDKKREIIFIQSSKELSKDKKYKIEINPDSKISLKDTSNNSIDTKKNFIYFLGNSDTVLSKLTYKFNIKDSSNSVELEPVFDFEFNSCIKYPEAVDIVLQNSQDNKPIEIIRSVINSRIIRIKPQQNLKSANWYKYKVKMDTIFDFNREFTKDSIFSINFLTVDKRNYGSVNGENRICKTDYW